MRPGPLRHPRLILDGLQRATETGLTLPRRILRRLAREARRMARPGAAGASASQAQRGIVDECTETYVRGWAVGQGNQPARIAILVNGRPVAEVGADVYRPDLERAGIPVRSGFRHIFAGPVSESDQVEVRFADGRPLDRSPCSANADQRERRKRLLAGVDLDRMRGLEIGPLHRPILSKSRGEVHYVDHASREELLRKYAKHPVEAVDPALVVEVDFVWPGGALADVVPKGMTFDYCVAAHVIEHLADPITWLGHLAAVLKPGGRICLAIPEKTRTFDYRRALSTPADLIDAYVRKLQRPGARQVFDHEAFWSPVDRKREHLPVLDDQRLRDALAAARSAESGTYHDAHCHVFTLPSFLECWEVIARLKLVPLALAEAFEPLPGWDEFIVILRKIEE